jgi:cytochrome c oxidase cbb3-type subunit 3
MEQRFGLKRISRAHYRLGALGPVLAGFCAIAISACDVEKRAIGPSEPSSPPTGAADGRAKRYGTNRYEQAEGGRMFRWFGCDGCHTDPAPGYLDLADSSWRRGGAMSAIYLSIANGAPGMPPYAGRIPPQQIWQLAGYVRGLHAVKSEVRRRTANAQGGEPSGSTWKGPLE